MSNGRTESRERGRPGHLRGNEDCKEEAHQQEKERRRRRKEERDQREVQERLRRTGEAGHVWGVESGDAVAFAPRTAIIVRITLYREGVSRRRSTECKHGMQSKGEKGHDGGYLTPLTPATESPWPPSPGRLASSTRIERV